MRLILRRILGATMSKNETNELIISEILNTPANGPQTLSSVKFALLKAAITDMILEHVTEMLELEEIVRGLEGENNRLLAEVAKNG